jgi:hypothetical protein
MWSHGPVIVHRREINVGPQENILEAWYPLESDETAAFFEDDIEVSPYWFKWATLAIETNGPFSTNKAGADPKLIGVSLFRPIHDYQSDGDVYEKLLACTKDTPFILQQPCSWGAVYFAEPWRKFRKWYEEARREVPVLSETSEVPKYRSSRFEAKVSWKKYLLKIMHERGWYMIYPNFPNDENLAKNHLMPGEHPAPPKDLFMLPLVGESLSKLSDRVLFVLGRMPPLREMQAFNYLFKRVKNLSDLPNYMTLG